MLTKRVTSPRTGRKGWRFRLTNPATKQRTWRTFWYRDRRTAEQARDTWLEGLERRRIGMADNSGWTLPFSEAVEKFLREAPITSDDRRGDLRRLFAKNELELHTLGDLGNKGKLTARCVALARQGDGWDEYVRKSLQQPIKQLSRWAASIDLLPHDPLGAWRLLPRTSTPTRRKAFLPAEFQQVMDAVKEYDELCAHACPSAILYRALLVTGNRPGAVFGATVGDLRNGRVILPAGNGKKRNGMATIPPAFGSELCRYLLTRGNPRADALLFVSPDGHPVDKANVSHAFKRALVLAAVRKHWPADATADTDPLRVADAIFRGKARGFDGVPPHDPERLARRKRILDATEAVLQRIGPDVTRWLEGRDMYCLRKTHISWARRLVNADSVKLQVGHAPQDVEERHYLDLVDAREASQAVWDVLTGVRTLDGKRHEPEALALAVGAENMQGVDYRGDYGAESRQESRSGSARTGPQVVPMAGLEEMKGRGIEPRTNGLKADLPRKPQSSAPVPVSSVFIGKSHESSPQCYEDGSTNPHNDGLPRGLRELAALLAGMTPEQRTQLLNSARKQAAKTKEA